MVEMGLGDKIRNRRDAANLSARELARRTQISPTALGEIESGGTYDPSSRRVFRIARALNISVEWLLDDSVTIDQPASAEAAVQEMFRDAVAGTGSGLTQDEQDILRDFRKLDAAQQAEGSGYVRGLAAAGTSRAAGLAAKARRGLKQVEIDTMEQKGRPPQTEGQSGNRRA